MERSHPFLSDEQLRPELNLRAQISIGFRAGLGDPFGLAGLRAKGRLDDQFVKMFQDMAQSFRLAAPPGGEGGQFEFLAQDVPAQPRQEGQESRALQQAAAQRVGRGDVARAQHFEQARHAQHRVVAQFQRVAPVVVHAPQNHVHRFQPGEGLEQQAVIAHRQVLAFHQRITQIARQPDLLEIGFVERPRSQ